jgi:glycosyltransferase involved in cell wall biosynthesis
MGFIHDQLVAAGHSVDYFCADDVPTFLNGRLARFAFPLLVQYRAVTAARSGRPYDVINVHEPSAAAISTYRRAAGDPVVVVTSHGVERRGWELALEELRLGRGGPSLKTRLSYPLTSLWQSSMGLRRADHVFCLNSEDHDYLLQWLTLPKSMITRIYPGAGAIYSEAAKRRDYGRAGRLLFAATWRKNKGIQDLVPAFATLAQRHRDLKLILLGAGLPEPVVRSAFPEGIRSRIHCTDTISEAQNAAVFASADLYLLPSLFEGTPLTLIEAMMSGMPVITTATCGMGDIIQDGKNGLLVPMRSPEAIVEAVERLIGDAALRARLGQAAQTQALENYTWERVAIPVLERYEQLCNHRT